MMETSRLILRYFTDNDLEDFKYLIRNKMNCEDSIYDDQFPVDDNSLVYVFQYFINSKEFYAIELKNNNKLIGYVSLNVVDNQTRNLGYLIHSDYRRNGYGFEAATLIKNYAKELGIKKLVAGTAEENIPSVKIITKLGFTLIDKQLGSFVNDKNGKPIEFMGLSFECNL